jgi:hypothetical protein
VLKINAVGVLGREREVPPILTPWEGFSQFSLARRAFLMLLKQSTFQVEGITIIGVD